MASQPGVQDGGVVSVDGTHQAILPPTASKMPHTDHEEELNLPVSNQLEDEQIQEVAESSSDDEDDDVHQCGRCKEVFRNLQLYLTHKASKACKHSAKAQAARKSVSEEPQEAPTELTEPEPANSGDSEVPQENILEAAAKDTIYKQLQILVVDPDHADQQQVQTVLTEGQSNEAPVAFVAVQDETGQTVTVKAEELLPLNRPLMFGDSPSKKGRGRPRKSQPTKVQLSPTTGKPTTTSVTTPPPTTTTKSKSDKSGKGRTRGRPKTISLADFEGDDDVIVEPEESEDPQIKKKKGRPSLTPKSPKQKPPQMYTCSICKLEFPTKPQMAEHKAKHSKLFKCKTCNEGFFTEEKLNKHMEKETHHYECEHCGKVLVSKTSLQRHKAVHGDKSHVCEVCSRAFKTARDMRNHKLGVHSTVKDFKCEVCGKAFARREKLKRHSLIHSPNRPCLPCPFKNHTGCEKTFYRKDKLTRHLYSHSKIKPFKCDHCQKTFARTDNLREHMRTHTESNLHSDRPRFPCPFKTHTGCDKSFYRKDKLTRHLFTHSKEKPFKCEECQKTFARDDNLREHMRKHTGLFRYYCTVCGKGQPGPKKYLQHMLKSHNIEDAEVPLPLEDTNTPEHLIELHKATILAEQATKAARQSAGAARSRKKKQTEIEEEIFNAPQQVPLHHHATMVSSLSTVALSQIAPLSTMAHAAAALTPPPHTPPAIPQPPHPQVPHIQTVQIPSQPIPPTPPMRPLSRPMDLEQTSAPVTSRRPSGPPHDENGQNTEPIRPRSIPEHVRATIPEHARVTGPEHTRVTMPEHARVTMPEHVRVTMPEHVRVTMPEHVRVTMPEHARVTMPEHVRVTMEEHVRVTMPEHVRVTMPEQVRVTMPEHVRVTMPEHVRVSMPEHVRNTIPEHARGSVPEHLRGNMPDLVRNSIPDHVRNAMPEHLRTTVPDPTRMSNPARVSMPDHGRSSVEHVRSPSEMQTDASRGTHGGQPAPGTGDRGSAVTVQMLPQSVIQQNMHFTNLLNSDLANIGEAVVRNQNPLPVMSTIFKNFPNPPPAPNQP